MESFPSFPALHSHPFSSIIKMLGGIWATAFGERLSSIYIIALCSLLCVSFLTILCLPPSHTNGPPSLCSCIHTVKDHFLQLHSRVYGSLMKTVIMIMDILKPSDGPCALMKAEVSESGIKRTRPTRGDLRKQTQDVPDGWIITQLKSRQQIVLKLISGMHVEDISMHFL